MEGLEDLLGLLPPELKEPSEDPLITGMARAAEAAKQRREASRARWEEACPDHQKWLTEKSWRKQVRKKKEEERRRLAKEAAAEARRAEEARALQAKAPVLSPAEQALQEAKRAAEAAKRAAEAEWLENQWQPQLLRRQEEARAQRLEAEAWERQKKQAEEDRQQYEQNGMATEDARARQHMADLARECERLCERAKTPRVASSIARKIELVLEMRGLEIRWKQNLEKRRLEEQAALLALQNERRERDYREWRGEVQEERLRRRRLVAREEQRDKELQEWKRLELLGRDVLREEELKQQSLLEEAMEKSSRQKQQLEAQGISPQRVLEEAQKLAEKQRKIADEVGPKQAEQELWEALLAKNRMARTDRDPKTPRWGFFAERC
ncbi:unnamed protein product [Effrenium voratum]|nr:unnamed protein product [Effrenium voratum]